MCIRDRVQRVREVCLGAYAHQDLPFEQLVDALHPDRELDKTPLFQVMFAPQSASTAELDLPGVAASSLNIHPGMAKFDLTVFVDPGPEQIATLWEYNTDLFERATIERIAAHYEALLAQLTEAPELRPSAASLVTAAERNRLLALGAAPAEY